MSSVRQQAEEAAAKLLGSCDDTPGEIYSVEGFAEILDEIVGRCEGCDWWVDASELNEDYVCEECADE